MKAKTKFASFLFLMLLTFVLSTDTFAQGNGKGNGKGGPPPWAPAHGYRARQVYFPEHNFYFDTQKNVYIYPSGGSWQISVQIPSLFASFDLKAAVKVELDLNTDSPQKYNSEHVATYKVKNKGNGNGNGNGNSKEKSNNSSKGKNK